MDDRDGPAGLFEEHRPHLRAVAFRMLGSAGEAEDAVQETWLRFDVSDTSAVANLAGWLTTVVSRVCLNMLRSRRTRREEPLDAAPVDPPATGAGTADPEDEAVLADAVGMAMLVVLDTLSPVERVAFVLHDMFAVPFDDIAAMLDRSPDSARQLASRARRRVRGHEPPRTSGADVPRQRQVVDAFRTAARRGDFDALLAVLAPQVVLHADRAAIPSAEPVDLRGAEPVARGARLSAERAAVSEFILVDGAVGLVYAPPGRPPVIMAFTVEGDRISAIDIVADPERFERLELALLD